MPSGTGSNRDPGEGEHQRGLGPEAGASGDGDLEGTPSYEGRRRHRGLDDFHRGLDVDVGIAYILIAGAAIAAVMIWLINQPH